MLPTRIPSRREEHRRPGELIVAGEIKTRSLWNREQNRGREWHCWRKALKSRRFGSYTVAGLAILRPFMRRAESVAVTDWRQIVALL